MITSFPTPDSDNIGGCRAFKFIEADKVVSMPVASGKMIKSQITLSEGATWRDGYASVKSLEYSEKMRENDAGKYFVTEITGFYPKINNETLALFSEMKHSRFIVIITDNNGLSRVAGTIETPLEFTFDASSGRNASSRNGLSFAFKGQFINESPFYSVNIG